MGLVGAGIFKMTNSPDKTVNSPPPDEEKICLKEAYAPSASEDKLMDAAFADVLSDGLSNDLKFS